MHQNNATKHIADTTPSQSPDLNPIEHEFHLLKSRLKETTQKQLIATNYKVLFTSIIFKSISTNTQYVKLSCLKLNIQCSMLMHPDVNSRD